MSFLKELFSGPDPKKAEEDRLKTQREMQIKVVQEYRDLKRLIDDTTKERDKSKAKAMHYRTIKNMELMHYHWSLYQMYHKKVQELINKRRNAKIMQLNMKSASSTKSTVGIIQSGTTYMKSVHSGITLDGIDNSILNAQDAEAINIDAELAVSSSFSSMDSGITGDYDDIMKEMDMLMIDSDSSSAGGGDHYAPSTSIPSSLPVFPSVPKDSLSNIVGIY
jgi:hypothetical protein